MIKDLNPGAVDIYKVGDITISVPFTGNCCGWLSVFLQYKISVLATWPFPALDEIPSIVDWLLRNIE